MFVFEVAKSRALTSFMLSGRSPKETLKGSFFSRGFLGFASALGSVSPVAESPQQGLHRVEKLYVLTHTQAS